MYILNLDTVRLCIWESHQSRKEHRLATKEQVLVLLSCNKGTSPSVIRLEMHLYIYGSFEMGCCDYTDREESLH